MTTDINNFITLDTFKNGRLKISQTVEGKTWELNWMMEFYREKGK
jgi:hypothetical protein